MRRWGPDREWRRRADINSLALAALLVLIAVLFAFQQGTAGDIQDSRVDVARDSCNAQNDRHDETIRTLDRVLLQRLTGEKVDSAASGDVVARRLLAALQELPEARRAQASQSRTTTVLLIQALAPRRNCKALVKQIRAVD